MSLLRRIRSLGKRDQLDREIRSELEEHVQMAIDDSVARGMDPKQAAREARLRFGNPTVVEERVGAEDAALGLDSILRDLRYALRGFAKNPAFTAVAILTLALGIGANTAVFQLIDALRLRRLPIQKPSELVELRIAQGNRGFGITDDFYDNFTIPMWQEVRRHRDPLSGIFAWRRSDDLFGPLSDAKHIRGIEVSGEYFNVLGVTPWLGRLIQPEDETSDCQVHQVVVSYPFWKSQLAAQLITPQTTLLLDGKTVQVVGVAPPGFFGVAVGTGFDVAFPTCRPAHPRREMFIFSVMGRLKPGWSIAQASEYFAALSPGLFASTAPDGYSAQALKTFTSFRLAAYPAGSGVSSLRDAYDSPLRLLLAITGLVLLIACANLANLMLARASVRQREMAIRKALGATPRRLLRQMLIESGLLAAMGAGLGIALAQPLSRILVTTLSSSQNAIQLNIATDWRVLLFAAVVATLTCLLFAVVPALRSAGANPLASMRSGERGVVGHRERTSLQRFMVITQIAVSMVLLVGALLFVRSYRNLVTLDPGMRESGITVGYFGFGTFHIKPENEAAFKRQLVDEIRSVPGVQNAAATTNIPLNGGSWSHGVLVGTTEGSSRFTYASPTYFATMNIPLVSGRSFTAADTTGAPFVLIVNQAFVRHFLAGVDPVGQLVHVHEEPQYPARTYQIIGTIADTRYQDLRTDLQPIAFVPIDQLPVTAQGPGAAMLIASTDSGATNAIRRDLNAKYPGMIMEFADFQQNIRNSLIGDRMMAMLSGFFGVLAVLLVVIGLYGVLSYLIAQRRNEIGLRIALGARRWQVIALVLRNTAAMSLIGIFTGAGLALLAARTAGSMLFGLSASDPATLIASALILASIAILASWIPARSASRLDPLAALRSE